MPEVTLPIIKPVPEILALSQIDSYLESGIDEGAPDYHHDKDSCLFWHVGLRDNVAMGTHLINHFSKNVANGIEYAPAILLYRHMLDLADSLGTLVRLGSTIPCSILLRALLEATFQFEFLLKGPSDDPNSYHDRANCHLTFFYIKRLESVDKVDPSHEKGKAYHQLLKESQMLNDMEIPEIDYQSERNNLQEILDGLPFEPYYQKYKSLKKGKKSGKKAWTPSHWYSLCSSIRDIRELSRVLGREAEYEVLYRYFSDPVHGGDVYLDSFGLHTEEKMLIRSLRGPRKNLEMAAHLSNTYLLNVHILLREGFFKENAVMTEFFQDWYLKWREASGYIEAVR
jgi:Family of unknown function (DUF5677)